MEEFIKALTEMIKSGGVYAIQALLVYVLGNLVGGIAWCITIAFCVRTITKCCIENCRINNS